MSVPLFIDIEYVQSDDCCFPTAIAWSLPSGQIKAVVIEPDDSWLTDEVEDLDVDLRYLREQGVPLLELVRELNEDLSNQSVFSDGLDPDPQLADILFEAVDMETPFEILPIEELIEHADRQTLEDHRRALLFERGLEPQLPENGVYALLLLAQEEGLLVDLPLSEDL
ncbi:MAG: hypothetical protein LAT63_04110 [Marinobacter sp.]|nr:hypothetical protein [Marinobacter sp.]